jgi:hypothetical protein
MAEFKLIPADVPPAGRRGRASVYTEMVEQFLAQKTASVRVQYDRKPATVYISLKRVVRSDPRFAAVKVSQRGKDVYLIDTSK